MEGHFKALRAVFTEVDGVALLFKRAPDEAADLGFIFNDENARGDRWGLYQTCADQSCRENPTELSPWLPEVMTPLSVDTVNAEPPTLREKIVSRDVAAALQPAPSTF